MRAEDIPAGLADMPCPEYGETTPVAVPPVAERRVAIISTAGLIQRGDRPFGMGAADYRLIDSDLDADLLVTHLSTNFDRSGFLQDSNVMFPLDRLREAASRGGIGSVARNHYSFMGATDPQAMKPAAKQLARAMHGEGTNIGLLVPV